MAYSMPGQLTRAEKQRRASLMKKELDAVSVSVTESFSGQRARVILEQRLPDGSFSGYTDRYIPAKVIAEGSSRNDIVTGTISCVDGMTAVITADNASAI